MARWIDGEPQDLPAAALDALEWLKYLRRHGRLSGGKASVLAGCIAALEAQLEGEAKELLVSGDGVTG